jgi:hypothetical protein
LRLGDGRCSRTVVSQTCRDLGERWSPGQDDWDLDSAVAIIDLIPAPGVVTAAADLFGTEAAQAALALGVPPERITTIAAGPNPPGGVRATRGGAGEL